MIYDEYGLRVFGYDDVFPAEVEVTARYTDCSMWTAPCCGRPADDRGETGWKSTKDYYPIERGGRR